MTRLWIALKNPPFKRDGFDKPMFFNSYWKRKNNLTEDQVIAKAMEVFDNAFFEDDKYIDGEITRAIDFQHFTIRLPQTNDIFRSSFFKVKFEKEDFVRYCWVVGTNYVGQNTIEFTLQTDLWMTFMNQIHFNPNRTIACKRRMPERYTSNDKGSYKDVLSIENNFLDPLSSSKYYPKKIVSFSENTDIANDKWAKYFMFHSNASQNKQGTFMYGFVRGSKDDPVKYAQNKEESTIQLPYFIYPILPDDTDFDQMEIDFPNFVDGIKLFKLYNTYSAFTSAALPSLSVILEIPSTPIVASNNANAYELPAGDVTYPGIRLASIGANLFYNGLVMEYSMPLDGYNFTQGKLFDGIYPENEPVISHSQVRNLQINNAFGNAPLIPYELFLDIASPNDEQKATFKMYNIVNGATARIFWRPNVKSYEGQGVDFGELFSNDYNYSFALNSDIPSIVGAWDTYMQNHRSSYYTGMVSGVVNNIAGAYTGITFGGQQENTTTPEGRRQSRASRVAKTMLSMLGHKIPIGNDTLGTGLLGGAALGVQALAGSVNVITGMIAQQNDLKRQANAVNTSPTDYIQSVMMSKDNGIDPIIGVGLEVEVAPFIKEQLVLHYRLFGNPIQDRIALNYDTLQKREFWNYWQLDDIQNTFVFDNIPPFVIDYLDELFTNGVRLWPVWWDANEKYIDTVYDYDKENWETSLKLELPTPKEENNGIL